jgi:hypothetical protein
VLPSNIKFMGGCGFVKEWLSRFGNWLHKVGIANLACALCAKGESI